MKKRNIMLGSAILLVALLVVGTMAWFTSNPEAVENTFTAGTVKIELLENEEVVEDGLEFDNVNPGDKYDKKVEVENFGSKQTYVRVKVDILWEDVDAHEGFVANALNVAEVDFNLDNWTNGGDGYYYYKDIVKTTGKLPPLFTEVKFKGLEMGNEYQGSTLKIRLKAEAVQASHYAFRTEWGITGDPAPVVPATGVEKWEE